MDIVKRFLFDRLGRFLVCCLLGVLGVYLFFETFNIRGFLNAEPIIEDTYNYSVYIELFFLLPMMIIVCIKNIIGFFGICIDFFFGKTKTKIVKGVDKSYKEYSDSYSTTKKKNVFAYYKWKVKSSCGISYNVIIPKDVKGLIPRGKTKKQRFKITYYRFSKIVTNIEKINN